MSMGEHEGSYGLDEAGAELDEWKARIEAAERDQHLLRRTVADQRDRIQYLEGKGGVTWERAQAAERERDSETRRADNAIDDYQRVIRERNDILAGVRRLCEDDPCQLSAEIRGLLDREWRHGIAR